MSSRLVFSWRSVVESCQQTLWRDYLPLPGWAAPPLPSLPRLPGSRLPAPGWHVGAGSRIQPRPGVAAEPSPGSSI